MQRDPFYVAFGALVRVRREVAELSQAEVARLVGVDRTTISNIETGRQGVPIKVLARLADALGCNPGDLVPASNEVMVADEDEFVTAVRQAARLKRRRDATA